MEHETTSAGYCPRCAELILCPVADDWPAVGQTWTLTRHRGHATERLTLTPAEIAAYRAQGVRVLEGLFHGV